MIAPRRVEVVLLSVFGDESADEKQQRVFAVSGVCGSESEWKVAIDKWTTLTNGQEFHAADWEKAGKDYLPLAEFLGEGIVAGFAVSLDLAAFREVFPYSLRDTGYYQCFSKVLQIHTNNAIKWNERVAANPGCGDPPIELEFTFDHRKTSEGNAGTLYSAFINQPEWKNARILSGKVSFDCRTNPRIQIADLVAREAMKELDRSAGLRRQDKRKEYIALESNGAFRFIELDREYCLQLREEVKKSGTEPGYWEWLKKTKRVQHGKPHDNFGNRFSYYIYLLNKEALEAKQMAENKDFEKFDATMRKLVRIPHDEVKAKLDAEKAAKKRKPKKTSASGRVSCDKD